MCRHLHSKQPSATIARKTSAKEQLVYAIRSRIKAKFCRLDDPSLNSKKTEEMHSSYVVPKTAAQVAHLYGEPVALSSLYVGPTVRSLHGCKRLSARVQEDNAERRPSHAVRCCHNRHTRELRK